MAERPGIKAELARRADEVGSAGARAEAGETPSLFPEALATVVTSGPQGRKPGRPPGSTNLKGGRIAAYYLRTEGDPLLDLVRFSRRDLLGLVMELQAVATATGVRMLGKNQSLLDLVKEQRAAAEAALPYLHQRMPLALEIDKGGRNVLIVGTPTPEQMDAAADVLGLDLRAAIKPRGAVEGVEYQRLGDAAADPSPLDPSPLQAQALDFADDLGVQADD